MPKVITPAPMLDSYTCPFCDTTAAVKWYGIDRLLPAVETDSSQAHEWASEIEDPPCYQVRSGGLLKSHWLGDWLFGECAHCGQITVWHRADLVYPARCPVEDPNPDMPGKVRECYLEAARVFSASPRAAAALLRLGLQILLGELLGVDSKSNIHEDIKTYSQTAPEQIVKALDAIRISGNESVHPGTINLNDDPDSAAFLFTLMNMICEESITRPKRLDAMYDTLPESKRIVK